MRNLFLITLIVVFSLSCAGHPGPQTRFKSKTYKTLQYRQTKGSDTRFGCKPLPNPKLSAGFLPKVVPKNKKMKFRSITPNDYEAVRRFLTENGWEKRVDDTERFRQMMENASRTVVAFDGERVIGFARALCDDVSNGYIGTVAVAEDFRGRGIGRRLVERLIGEDKNITWVLRARQGSEQFWQKMGFNKSEVAMEKTRGK